MSGITSKKGWTSRRISMARNGTVTTLLLRLGIDVRARHIPRGRPCDRSDCPRRCAIVKHVTFWKRDPHEILETLKRARSIYIARVKEHHPDRGGDPRQMTTMNTTWAALVSLFAKRGYTLHD